MRDDPSPAALAGKSVALFGGSFNPPHEGHLGMAAYLQTALHTDETWMLFSISPHKNPSDYAPLEHRMNMADILAKHYDAPIRMSGLEDTIAREKGRHDTYYILQGLTERYPDTQFVWVMGADSFATFHLWKERDDILNEYVVAVVDRPGYTQQALQSPTAIAFAEQRIDVTDPAAVRHADHGWCFVPTPLIEASSSGLLEKLRTGATDIASPFADIVDYIHANDLYGLGGASPRPSPPYIT